MPYTIIYHPDTTDDLDKLGKPIAQRVLTAIGNKLENGDPEKFGEALRNELSGCRRLRVGDVRVVYRVNNNEIEVLILAIGPRRNDEIYKTARKRVSEM